MNKKSIIILLVLIIAVFAATLLFRQSEEQKVKARITGLAGQVSKEGGEAVLKTALRLKGVGAFFGDPVLFEIYGYDISGVYTPGNVVNLAGAASGRFKSFTLKFYDIDVEFPEDSLALASATVIVTGRIKSGGAFDEAKEVDIELIKAGEEWYITRISTVDLLEK